MRADTGRWPQLALAVAFALVAVPLLRKLWDTYVARRGAEGDFGGLYGAPCLPGRLAEAWQQTLVMARRLTRYLGAPGFVSFTSRLVAGKCALARHVFGPKSERVQFPVSPLRGVAGLHTAANRHAAWN